MGVLLYLDEPSIGLHAPGTTNRLLNTLKSLRDIGNSILVVNAAKKQLNQQIML